MSLETKKVIEENAPVMNKELSYVIAQRPKMWLKYLKWIWKKTVSAYKEVKNKCLVNGV